MEKLVLTGIYKRNTRGRAYLVYYNKDRSRSICRITARLDAGNGAYIRIIGTIKDRWILVSKLISVEGKHSASQAGSASHALWPANINHRVKGAA